MDRRKDSRFPAQLHVKLDVESKTYWGVLGDVSESGLFIKTNQDIAVNAIMSIEIFMPDNTISKLTGTVIRKVNLSDPHRKYGIGIQLKQKDRTYESFLERFSSNNQQQDNRG